MTPWRRWHRWLGTVAGLLLVLIGATGIFLQVDELTGMSDPPKAVPVDESQLVAIDPVALTARAQTLLDRRHHGEEMISLRIEARAVGPVAIARFKGSKPVEVDLRTGEERPAVDPQAKRTPVQRVRLLVLNLHTFGLAGAGGHVLGALASAVLIFLSGSGLWMWLSMRNERTGRRKGSWFWR